LFRILTLPTPELVEVEDDQVLGRSSIRVTTNDDGLFERKEKGSNLKP